MSFKLKITYGFCATKICVSYSTIKKTSKHFDKKTMLVLYNSMIIISNIRYCITLISDLEIILEIVMEVTLYYY